MRLLTPALCATVAVWFLAGCSGGNLSTPSTSPQAGAEANHLVNGRFVPGRSTPVNLIPAELLRAPAAVLDRIAPERNQKKGGVDVYGSQYFAGIINGYSDVDPKNRPPFCRLTANYPSDIAVDGEGNLIDPDGGTASVIVYKPNCGSSLGTIGDSYGEPSDAASFDAVNKRIIVANTFGTSGPGNIAICKLSGGCTMFLTKRSTMWEVAGVTLAKNGDCWASASDSTGTATMTYFKHCLGSGLAATGWKNTYYGGLDIDTSGRIVAVDAFVPRLWIYSGCKPACHVVAGPFPLHGDTVFGHLNRVGTLWVGADYENGMLDVYKYRKNHVTYEYSISNGFTVSDSVEGAAFSPPSRQ